MILDTLEYSLPLCVYRNGVRQPRSAVRHRAFILWGEQAPCLLGNSAAGAVQRASGLASGSVPAIRSFGCTRYAPSPGGDDGRRGGTRRGAHHWGGGTSRSARAQLLAPGPFFFFPRSNLAGPSPRTLQKVPGS